MSTVATKPMTFEEFKALPEGPPHYEFEEGELIPMASPKPKHQDIIGVLWNLLWQFARRKKLGRVVMEVDVFLPDGRVFTPDVSFVPSNRLHYFDPEDEKIHGSPDLVVEVLSEEADRDRVHKFRIYHENGVEWYWIVDPELLTIEEYHFTPKGYIRTASIAAGEAFKPKRFPGLVINLKSLLEAE